MKCLVRYMDAEREATLVAIQSGRATLVLADKVTFLNVPLKLISFGGLSYDRIKSKADNRETAENPWIKEEKET